VKATFEVYIFREFFLLIHPKGSRVCDRDEKCHNFLDYLERRVFPSGLCSRDYALVYVENEDGSTEWLFLRSESSVEKENVCAGTSAIQESRKRKSTAMSNVDSASIPSALKKSRVAQPNAIASTDGIEVEEVLAKEPECDFPLYIGETGFSFEGRDFFDISTDSNKIFLSWIENGFVPPGVDMQGKVQLIVNIRDFRNGFKQYKRVLRPAPPARTEVTSSQSPELFC
jgi:hypothetical protein